MESPERSFRCPDSAGWQRCWRWVVGIEEIFKNHSQIGERAAGKVIATSADGLAPTKTLVSGKVVEAGSPVNVVAFPTLPESKERVIG